MASVSYIKSLNLTPGNVARATRRAAFMEQVSPAFCNAALYCCLKGTGVPLTDENFESICWVRVRVLSRTKSDHPAYQRITYMTNFLLNNYASSLPASLWLLNSNSKSLFCFSSISCSISLIDSCCI